MAKCDKVEQRARQSPRNLSFNDLLYLAECHGFVLARTRGSHHIYKHDQLRQAMNFQSMKDGSAKPYQVGQLLDAIDILRDG